MAKLTYLTEEGLQQLRDELDRLTRVERPAISRQIAEARDKGDLSENAEYDAAKEAQGMLEMKIAKLQEILMSARLIDQSKLEKDIVQILSKVKMRNRNNGAVMTYTIVSESEANLKEGKIAINTPIAKGLLGKKAGDQVDVIVPSGKISLEIIEISR